MVHGEKSSRLRGRGIPDALPMAFSNLTSVGAAGAALGTHPFSTTTHFSFSTLNSSYVSSADFNFTFLPSADTSMV